MRRIYLMTAAALLAASITACGGGGSAEATTAAPAPAQETTAAPETKAPETAAPATTAAPETTTAPETTVMETEPENELNYDYANLMNAERSEVEDTFGAPKEEEKSGDSVILNYENGDRFACYTDDSKPNFGRENMVWLIESTAGRMLNLKEKTDDPEAYLESLGAEEPVRQTGSMIEDYTFGGKNTELIVFQLEGYSFEMALNEEGGIDPDCAIAYSSPVEREEGEPEEEVVESDPDDLEPVETRIVTIEPDIPSTFTKDGKTYYVEDIDNNEADEQANGEWGSPN